MKKQHSEIITYPTPVLRVAFRNLIEPVTLRKLPESDMKYKDLPVEETPGIKKTGIPDSYQYHINPKRFEFF